MTGSLGAIVWLLVHCASGELYRPPPNEVNKGGRCNPRRAKTVMLEKKNTPFKDIMEKKREIEMGMGLCCTGKRKTSPTRF